MDVTDIAKLSTSIADTGTKQAVSIAVLKKAEDVQASTAAQLLNALPQPTPAQNLPSHLGNYVNTTA